MKAFGAAIRGPWFHREKFGFSFWDLNYTNVNNVVTLRTRWGGDLKYAKYGEFKAGDSVAAFHFDRESHPENDNIIRLKEMRVNAEGDEYARVDTIQEDPETATWIRFDSFDFSAEANVFYINTASKHAPINAKIHVYLGGPNATADGELLGTITPIETGHKNLYIHSRLILSRNLNAADTGKDLYLTFEGSGYNIVSFHFEKETLLGNVIDTNISAVDYSDKSDEGLKDLGSKIGYINKPSYPVNNPWIRFDSFNLAGGATKFYVETNARFWPKNYQDPNRISRIRVRLDAPDGEIIATVVPKKTGSWNTFVEQPMVPLTREISGSQTIYLTFEGHGYDVKSFRFE